MSILPSSSDADARIFKLRHPQRNGGTTPSPIYGESAEEDFALPEKQHLFKKQLSKHSIGAYRELCREVGVSFEAVPTTQLDAIARSKSDEENQEKLPTKLHNEDSTIESEKLHLTAELDKLSGQVTEASDERDRAEKATSQLKSALQATEKDKQFFQQ
ncbi:MAG: hypothetical protein Q9217_005703 [Psora testacea]